jgi:hypothetical protein
MGRSEDLAARFAACVERFREPGAKDEQKAAFRRLLELLHDDGLYLREDERGVQINGAPVNADALGALGHRLALHNVSEIRIPPAPPPAEVFTLMQALAEAAAPAGEDVASRLATDGATKVRVTVGPPSSQASDSPRAEGLGTDGLLRGDPMTDIRSVPTDVAGVSGFTFDPEPPAPDHALPSIGSAPAPEVVFGPPAASAAPTATPAPTAMPIPPPAAIPPAAVEVPPPVELRDSIPAGSRVGNTGLMPDPVDRRPSGGQAARAEMLSALTRQPAGPQVGDLLATLGQQVADAVRGQDFEGALQVLAALVDLEQRVPEGVRRQYGIAFRRMYSKPLLHGLAGLVSSPGYQAAAVIVLQRAGADGVEVLLERLATEQAIAERRALFDALRHMRDGRSQLIHMLGDPKWFVARNAADLIGELGVEDAVPALAQLLNHGDERLRKAAALALAKIGTKAAGEPLRRALRDPSPEIRLQVAMGVGGPRAQGLAMPLVVALEEEKEEAVQRELVLALGRIGTSDAVQALIKVAQTGGRVFGRKPVALRLAAVDALRLAGSPAAAAALDGLSNDSDRQVGAAAQAALSDLKRKPK